MQNFDHLKLGFCTLSAGSKPEDTLPVKLQAIAAAGFTGIELGFPDLVSYAKTELGSSFKGEADWDALEQVAKTVRTKCEELGLYVATIVPFGPFGGFGTEQKRKDAMERAEGWFKIIRALGNPMLQCGTSNEPDCSPNIDDHVKDVQLLGDQAAKHDIKIAYEQWCWGTYLNTWQHSWEVVKRANRPNVGLCLDTFQMCGRAYADPANEDGLDHTLKPDPESHLRESLHELATTVPADKIYYLQLSSACKMSPPVKATQEQSAREVWSMSYRPMPFQPHRNDYLPVMPALEAVLKTGWRGPLTVETFDAESMSTRKPIELTKAAYDIITQKMLPAFQA